MSKELKSLGKEVQEQVEIRSHILSELRLEVEGGQRKMAKTRSQNYVHVCKKLTFLSRARTDREREEYPGPGTRE